MEYSTQEGSLAIQVRQEAKKLKEFYKSSSKEIEKWPRSDQLVYCSDDQFDDLLKCLPTVDLEAAVLILKREIDIVQQKALCLETLRTINSSQLTEIAAKLINTFSTLARLRSRLLRCLTKQLRNNGNNSCELPHWSGTLLVNELHHSTHLLKGEAIPEQVTQNIHCEDTRNTTTEITEENRKTTNSEELPSSNNVAVGKDSVRTSTSNDQIASMSKENEVENNGGEASPVTKDGEGGKRLDSCKEHDVMKEMVTECEKTADTTKEVSQVSYSVNAKENNENPACSVQDDSPAVKEKESHQEEEAYRKTLSDEAKLGGQLAAPQSQFEFDETRKETLKLEELAGVFLKTVKENRQSASEAKVKQTEHKDKKKEESIEKATEGIPSHEASPPPRRPPPYRGNSVKKVAKKNNGKPKEQAAEDLPSCDSDEDEPDALVIQEQIHFQDWDPTSVLRDLFGDLKPTENPHLASCTSDDVPDTTVRMLGYMEKLPSSYKQKKSSMFKGWKKRHFKAVSGKLFYYEDHRSKDPLGVVDLNGCTVSINGKMMEITENDGTAALKVRCASTAEAQDWKEAIEAESKNTKSGTEESDASEGPVIIIDLGSSTVKAGFAQEEAWPRVIFPCVCAVDNEDDSNCVYGFKALEPNSRKMSKLRFPLRRSFKIDKLKFDPSDLIGILEHTFLSLKVDPSKYRVIMTVPQNTGILDKEELVEILLGFFRVEAVYLQEQAILAMYSYSAVSGIVVDIGDHIDVIPVVEGCIIESGETRLPYGGRQITDTLARHLTEKGHRFFSEVETYITRLIKEQSCYVSEKRINEDDDDPGHTTDVNLTKYDLPDGTLKVTLDTARYRCTEGLFDPHRWGKDHQGIHELTIKAIMACSMDMRKQMCRSIYLSGGCSMIPGFPERLQSEVSALLPQSSHAQVHAGTDRHHAAFIGASVVARLPIFDQLCVSQEEWNEVGPEALEKWQNI